MSENEMLQGAAMSKRTGGTNHHPAGTVQLHVRGPRPAGVLSAKRDLFLSAAREFVYQCEHGNRDHVPLERAAVAFVAAERDLWRTQKLCANCGADSNKAELCPRCDLTQAEGG